MNTNKWCAVSNISISIITEILLFRKRFSDKDYLMFKFLINHFFSMPNCSILHLSVLKYFKAMHQLGKLNLKILNEEHLISKIIDCYKKRDELPLCACFGALSEISNLISSYIDKENSSEWNSIVVKKNKDTYKILSKDELLLHSQAKSFFSFVSKKTIAIVFISAIAIIFVLFIFIFIK